MATNEQYGTWQADNEFNPAESNTNQINVGTTERILSAALGGYLLSSGLGNLTSNPLSGLVKTVLGGFLVYRGTSGNCPMYSALGKTKGVSHTQAVNIRTSLIVNKPRNEVYAFWRKLENLPLFMKHLASVTEIDKKHSHWEAVIPGNIGKIKWNAEIVKEEENVMIGWQSIPNSLVNNAGKVVFNDALGGQGTELEVVISYQPPAGEIGSGVAKMLNPLFEKVIRQDVMNFKEYIETKHNNKTGATNTASNAMQETMSSGPSGASTNPAPGMGANMGGISGTHVESSGSSSMSHTPGGNPATGATGTGTQHSSRITENQSVKGGNAPGGTGSRGSNPDQSITP